MASFRCYDNSHVIKTYDKFLSISNKTMVAIFPNVCLWRRSYSQNWEVLTFICQYGLRYCIVSPSFLVYCFVKIWATWENFLGKWLNAPPGKKLPVRLCSHTCYTKIWAGGWNRKVWWHKLGYATNIMFLCFYLYYSRNPPLTFVSKRLS